MMKKRVFLVGALAMGNLLATPAEDLRDELRAADVKIDVKTYAIPGTVGGFTPPSAPLVYGFADGIPAPVAAASTLGAGRIVAVGHDAFFEKASMEGVPGNRVFVEAALRWLAGGTSPTKVWYDRSVAKYSQCLAAPGRSVEPVDVPSGLAALPKGAVVLTAPENHGLSAVPATRAFLEKGGGVLCSVVGWGWHQVTGKSFQTQSAFNALFAGTGLVTDDRLQERLDKSGYAAKPTFEPLLEFTSAWLSNPVRLWPARPEAAQYPGLPTGPERVTRTVDVDLSVPRWHGTALFAAAGEPLTVKVPADALKLGLRLRIGSTHCNNTSCRPWKRAPIVNVEVPLNQPTLTLASPFGGLVYVVVPEGRKGHVAVEIGPACPAPTFRLGRDTAADWLKVRSAPAPFAELESGKVVLTVPSSEIRTLDDPAPLMRTWNEIMDLDAKLTGLPKERRFAERITADTQLCCGFMHAGYPIMIPTSSVKYAVNNTTIRTASAENVWGLFHEMGHNHQNYDWTFNGSVEVTVNFFTLYCYEKLCGIAPRKTRMGAPRLLARVKAWNEKGRPFDEWKNDPFLALDFFLRLQERFGWEAFEKMFAEYRTLKPEERPKSDLEKRRQWATRFSRIVGTDLTDEFAFMLK